MMTQSNVGSAEFVGLFESVFKMKHSKVSYLDTVVLSHHCARTICPEIHVWPPNSMLDHSTHLAYLPCLGTDKMLARNSGSAQADSVKEIGNFSNKQFISSHFNRSVLICLSMTMGILKHNI